MKVKVDRLVCEGGELIAEAELVRSISRCSKCETIILLFHFFIQNCAVRIFQATVNIVVAPGDNLFKTPIKCVQILSKILIMFLYT